MELVNWNPLSELDNLLSRRGLLKSFNDDSCFDWRPAADISETDEAYLIKADLPEVKKEDVELTVQNGVITLSGERRQESKQDSEKAHRVEKFYGKFTRSFTLPENVDAQKIEATQANGVLTVHLPKTEQPQPKSIRIDVR